MTNLQRLYRWYWRARKHYPQLPSDVDIRFVRLRDDLAAVTGNRKSADIEIHVMFRDKLKLAFRELAHEVTHLLHPRLSHGLRFEYAIARVKVAMESDPTWY